MTRNIAIAFRRTALSVAIMSALMGSAFAQSSPGAASLGAVAIGNRIGGSVSVINAGSSESHATSSAVAQSSMNSSMSAGNPNNSSVSVGGDTSTDLQNTAWNYSQGAGSTGSAQAGGYAAAGVAGVAAIPNVGAEGGYSAAGSAGNVSVGTNQGGYQEGQTTSNYSATLTYVNQPVSVNGVTNQQVTLTDTKTGDVFANNTTGNITLNTGTTTSPATTVLGGATNDIGSAGVFGAGVQAQAVTFDAMGNVQAAVSAGVPLVIGTAVSNGL